MHSGSVACMLSSIKMLLNLIRDNFGSPAPIQVQQITSATSSSSFSHCFLRILYRFSSLLLSSPASSFSSWSFRNSELPSNL